jgi:hypothetical protein
LLDVAHPPFSDPSRKHRLTLNARDLQQENRRQDGSVVLMLPVVLVVLHLLATTAAVVGGVARRMWKQKQWQQQSCHYLALTLSLRSNRMQLPASRSL